MAATDIATLVQRLDPTAEIDRRLLELIAEVEAQTEVEYFGTQYNLAVAYQVLHILAGEANNGAGAITSQRVGDIAVSYAVPTSNDDWLTSRWGHKFVALRKSLCVGMRRE